MMRTQKRKYTKGLNIGRKEGMDKAKLEILIGMEMAAKERIRMGSDDLWSKPRMRSSWIRSD
jgi:hypothetical protein